MQTRTSSTFLACLSSRQSEVGARVCALTRFFFFFGARRGHQMGTRAFRVVSPGTAQHFDLRSWRGTKGDSARHPAGGGPLPSCSTWCAYTALNCICGISASTPYFVVLLKYNAITYLCSALYHTRTRPFRAVLSGRPISCMPPRIL